MSPTRGVVGKALRPLTSRLDQRITYLARRAVTPDAKLDALHAALGASIDRAAESDQYLGRVLSRINESLNTLSTDLGAERAEVGTLRDELSYLNGDVHLAMRSGGPLPARDVTLDMLGEGFADVLNRSLGYTGLAAQAGVFVNDPVVHQYEPGGVRIAGVNERIVEVPFVFRESHRLAPGSRVLDVGASESLVSLSLAGLGHEVTAVDPRGYLLDHPKVTQVRSTLQDFEAEDRFDAAVLLSMIEHVGIDHYEQVVDPEADFDLMAQLRRLVRPGGFLFLTTPFGRARDAGFQRIYDDVRLRRLLEGWDVVSTDVVAQTSPTSWEHTDLGIEPIDDVVSRVVMVVATRSNG